MVFCCIFFDVIGNMISPFVRYRSGVCEAVPATLEFLVSFRDVRYETTYFDEHEHEHKYLFHSIYNVDI